MKKAEILVLIVIISISAGIIYRLNRSSSIWEEEIQSVQKDIDRFSSGDILFDPDAGDELIASLPSENAEEQSLPIGSFLPEPPSPPAIPRRLPANKDDGSPVKPDKVESLDVIKVDEAPLVDGVIDDSAWRKAGFVDGPYEGWEISVVHDGESIYLCFSIDDDNARVPGETAVWDEEEGIYDNEDRDKMNVAWTMLYFFSNGESAEQAFSSDSITRTNNWIWEAAGSSNGFLAQRYIDYSMVDNGGKIIKLGEGLYRFVKDVSAPGNTPYITFYPDEKTSRRILKNKPLLPTGNQARIRTAVSFKRESRDFLRFPYGFDMKDIKPEKGVWSVELARKMIVESEYEPDFVSGKSVFLYWGVEMSDDNAIRSEDVTTVKPLLELELKIK